MVAVGAVSANLWKIDNPVMGGEGHSSKSGCRAPLYCGIWKVQSQELVAAAVTGEVWGHLKVPGLWGARAVPWHTRWASTQGHC